MANNRPNNKHWTQRRWSEADSQFLLKKYKILGPTKCAAILKAPMPTVLHYAKKLNLRDTSRAPQKQWTQTDIAYITKNHGKKTITEMAAHLDRAETSVYAKIRWLARQPGSTIKTKFPRLTEEEKQHIEKLNKQKLADSRIAKIIHRSVNSVNLYLESKGLPSYKDGPPPWTEEETAYLIKHYKLLGAKECSNHLPGRTIYAVQKKMHFLRQKGLIECTENQEN